MKDDFTHSALPEATLSMLIAAARRHIKHALAALLEPYGLNAYQCWMIVLLNSRGPMSLSELAGRMWMDHPTTSRLVHGLEAMGLLQVRPDPSHGRRVLIDIRPEKRELVEQIHGRLDRYRDQFEKGLTAEEKKAIHSGLSKVILNLASLLEESPDPEASPEVQDKALVC